MDSSSKRSRGWCFTLNNPDNDKDNYDALEAAQYFVIGKEVGKEGTPHHQGYVYFKTLKSFKQVKQLVPRAHWEAQKGSFEEASDYCKKDGDFIEEGSAPMTKKQKGEKGKEFWDDVKEKAKAGLLDEIDSKVFVTHFSSLTKIATKYFPMPEDLDYAICGEWLYGPTRTGKSRTAREENSEFYLKKCNKWWDNYQNQEVVIIEDFDKQHAYLGADLKVWADRYAFPAEIKGGQINLRPKKIIVTSNWSPYEIWGDTPQVLEPIIERFKLRHFINKLNQA